MSNFGHQNVCILNYGKDSFKTQYSLRKFISEFKKESSSIPQ